MFLVHFIRISNFNVLFKYTCQKKSAIVYDFGGLFLVLSFTYLSMCCFIHLKFFVTPALQMGFSLEIFNTVDMTSGQMRMLSM